MAEPIRVLLADDHALLREGLRGMLERRGGIEVVADTGDGGEVLGLVDRARPDVLLTDAFVSGTSCLELAAAAARRRSPVRVMVCTGHPSEQLVVHALEAGAAGFLLKDGTFAELERAVRTVAAGESYLCAKASALLADHLRRAGDGRSRRQQPTPRQRQVLRLTAEGFTTKEIAAKLRVSQKTVYTHREQGMTRLGLREVADLVRYAIGAGLVVPPPNACGATPDLRLLPMPAWTSHKGGGGRCGTTTRLLRPASATPVAVTAAQNP